MNGETEVEEGAGHMRKRRTTMDDGRYLIYYTFDGEDEGAEGAAARRPEAETEAEAEAEVTEERNV